MNPVMTVLDAIGKQGEATLMASKAQIALRIVLLPRRLAVQPGGTELPVLLSGQPL
jgi:hypothetical protein